MAGFEDSGTVSIVVDDLDAVVRLLRGAGVEVSDPSPGVEGSYATLRDQDGTEVRLHAGGFGARDVSSTDEGAVRVLAEDEPTAEEADSAARRRKVPTILLPAALLVAAVVVFVAIREPPTSGTSANDSEGAISAQPAPTAGNANTATDTAGRDSAQQSGPIAGITAPWEVFALGDDTVARIEFAEGRVTKAELPGSTNRDSSLIVGPDNVLVAAGRQKGSYLVAGGTAERAPDELANLRRGLPGPKPGQLWVKRTTYELFSLDGKPLGESINPPEAARHSRGRPDGSGYVLFGMQNGYYVASPDGVRRITPGVLLAIGPSAALVRECDDRARCERVVIDRTDGSKRVLPSDGQRISPGPLGVGRIAPSGTTAAIRRGPRLTSIDLRSGAVNRIDMMPQDGKFHGSSGPQKLAWSPGSQWLFVVTDGRLVAIDMVSRGVHKIELPLDTVRAIAIRAGG